MYDLIVIGGGSGGLVTAIGASKLGAKVLLVERGKLGGDCLNSGCVPSKALIKSANVANLISKSKNYGIKSVMKINFEDVIKSVNKTITKIAPEDSKERLNKEKVKVLFGTAKFISKNEIEVSGKRYQSRTFCVATGASAFVPPIKGLNEVNYLTNENLFKLKTQPKHLVIIGGGPISIEMCQAFNRLSSKVTVLVRGNSLLSNEDSDVGKYMLQLLKNEGVKFIFNAKTQWVSQDKNIISVKLIGKKILCDTLFIATGRKPNVKGLGLEDLGVKIEKGIVTDKTLRTSVPNIFAVGDVRGGYQFTHVAGYEGGIVVGNALFKLRRKIDYSVLPWVTFTDPEVARVGGISGKSYKFDLKNLNRAVIENEDKGFLKVFINSKGKIIGATIISPHAGELISEFALAMKKGLKLKDISSVIHAYPTWGEANKMVSDMYYSEKLFKGNFLKISKFLIRFFRK